MSVVNKVLLSRGMLFAGAGVFASSAYYSYQLAKRKEKFEQLAASSENEDDLKILQLDNINNNNSNNNTIGACCSGCSPTAVVPLLGGDRVQQFSRIASEYDAAIGCDELFMGINLLRRMLLHTHAKGTVLEVGAGTGRNLPYYKAPRVRRVILVDASPTMLEQAQAKINQDYAKTTALQYAVKQADSASLKFCPDQAFDTVVDTFGLCSYQYPEQVLREMVRVCKPDGKILLLEHGRSRSCTWLNDNVLDPHVADHARKWGCIWNRDLDEILKRVHDVLDLQVLNTWHFGTTYYVVGQPKQQHASQHANFVGS